VEGWKVFSSLQFQSHCGEVEVFLDEVFQIALRFFGSRVHYWSSYGFEDEPSPVYTWAEVDEADVLANL
jgi:hypothetical protein